MPNILLNGVNIYYESHGDGFPLILTYGLGGNTGEWRNQIVDFSKSYRLILWDPRGHGQSDSPPEKEKYNHDFYAEDLNELMNHLNIPKAYVGGLSMGGGIATRFALKHPERVQALLIIDSASASGVARSPELRAMREKTIELAETQGMAAVAEYAIINNPNIAGRVKKGPEAEKLVREMFIALNPKGYANAVRAGLSAVSITDKLGQLKMPTLLLVGEEDPALPAVRLTHEKISHSKLVIIPNAGHLSNQDQPEIFNKELLQFLSGTDSKS
ncbi:alpha/beta fold hydrolase [Chloroflexota bacterium]